MDVPAAAVAAAQLRRSLRKRCAIWSDLSEEVLFPDLERKKRIRRNHLRPRRNVYILQESAVELADVPSVVALNRRPSILESTLLPRIFLEPLPHEQQQQPPPQQLAAVETENRVAEIRASPPNLLILFDHPNIFRCSDSVSGSSSGDNQSAQSDADDDDDEDAEEDECAEGDNNPEDGRRGDENSAAAAAAAAAADAEIRDGGGDTAPGGSRGDGEDKDVAVYAPSTPVDVLSIVYNTLQRHMDFKSLLNLSSTCRTMRNVFRENSQTLKVVALRGRMPKFFYNFDRVRRFTFSLGRHPPRFSEIGQFLTHLTLNRMGRYKFQSLPQTITHLTVQHCPHVYISKTPPSLKIVKIDGDHSPNPYYECSATTFIIKNNYSFCISLMPKHVQHLEFIIDHHSSLFSPRSFLVSSFYRLIAARFEQLNYFRMEISEISFTMSRTQQQEDFVEIPQCHAQTQLTTRNLKNIHEAVRAERTRFNTYVRFIQTGNLQSNALAEFVPVIPDDCELFIISCNDLRPANFLQKYVNAHSCYLNIENSTNLVYLNHLPVNLKSLTVSFNNYPHNSRCYEFVSLTQLEGLRKLSIRNYTPGYTTSPSPPQRLSFDELPRGLVDVELVGISFVRNFTVFKNCRNIERLVLSRCKKLVCNDTWWKHTIYATNQQRRHERTQQFLESRDRPNSPLPPPPSPAAISAAYFPTRDNRDPLEYFSEHIDGSEMMRQDLCVASCIANCRELVIDDCPDISYEIVKFLPLLETLHMDLTASEEARLHAQLKPPSLKTFVNLNYSSRRANSSFT